MINKYIIIVLVAFFVCTPIYAQSRSLRIGNRIIASTPGSLLFTDNNNKLAEDSTNLLWDDTNKRLGIGTNVPTQSLDINSDSIRIRTAKTPPSPTATGTQGQIAWDSGFVYVCIATDTWKRSAISTWSTVTFNLVLADGTSKILLDDGTSALLGI